MSQNETLGSLIRKQRMKKGMSQLQLAQGICTSSMVSQVESGRANPSLETLKHLAERLEIPLGELLVKQDTYANQRLALSQAKSLLLTSQFEKAYEILSSLQGEEQKGVSIVEILQSLAVCCSEMGRHKEAMDVLDHAMDTFEAQTDVVKRVRVWRAMGAVKTKTFEFQMAHFFLQKAYDLLMRSAVVEDVFLKIQLQMDLGDILFNLGKADESLVVLQQAYEMRDLFGSVEDLGRLHLQLSMSYREQGQFQKAAEYADQARALLSCATNQELDNDVSREQALVLSEQGNHTEALQILNRCRARALQGSDLLKQGLVELDLASVLRHTGEIEPAIEIVHGALEKVASDELTTAKAYLLLAELCHQNGMAVKSAVNYLNQAMITFEKYGQFADLRAAVNLSVELYETSVAQTA